MPEAFLNPGQRQPQFEESLSRNDREAMSATSKNDRTARFREEFLQKLFAGGEVYRQSFDKLCTHGCRRDHLGNLLFAICTISRFGQSKLRDSGVSKVTETGESDLDNLPQQLRSMADTLDRISKTILAPQAHLPEATKDRGTLSRQRTTARLYRLLPAIIRAYSLDLEALLEAAPKALKNLTMNHVLVANLLAYVEDSAGRPYYNDVSNLLIGGFSATLDHPDSDLPEFFDPEALAKLRKRNPHVLFERYRREVGRGQ